MIVIDYLWHLHKSVNSHWTLYVACSITGKLLQLCELNIPGINDVVQFMENVSNYVLLRNIKNFNCLYYNMLINFESHIIK